MKENEAYKLESCPKCFSGKLLFARTDDGIYIECLCCKFHKDKRCKNATEAAEDWNDR